MPKIAVIIVPIFTDSNLSRLAERYAQCILILLIRIIPVLTQNSWGNSKKNQFPSAWRTMYALVMEAKIINTLTIKSHIANFLGFIAIGFLASSTIFNSVAIL